MTDSFLIELIILAGALAFVVFKLRAALGRKTGHERPRTSPFSTRSESGQSDNVVSLPSRGNAKESSAPAPDASRYAPEGSALAQGLTEIQLADRSFDPEGFLGGAQSAYEMIITAYAEGDLKTLQSLCGDETYAAFKDAIDARQAEGQTVEQTFVGMNDAKIAEARMNGRSAEVTVQFVSELISCTKNADGAVIEGDPSAVIQVTDIWTFARDTRSSDPNWVLIETAEG